MYVCMYVCMYIHNMYVCMQDLCYALEHNHPVIVAVAILFIAAPHATFFFPSGSPPKLAIIQGGQERENMDLMGSRLSLIRLHSPVLYAHAEPHIDITYST